MGLVCEIQGRQGRHVCFDTSVEGVMKRPGLAIVAAEEMRLLDPKQFESM